LTERRELLLLSGMRQSLCTCCITSAINFREAQGPLTARAVHHIVAQAGVAAALPFPVHPHMLRHACGFYLANKGVDTRTLQQYLGHRNIQHTVRYTELTPHRFQDFSHSIAFSGNALSSPRWS
jgi:site-specific recombinase XerD